MDASAVVSAVLLLILAAGIVAGLIKGLIRQVVELVGLVGSFFIAIFFAGWLAELLQDRLSLSYSPSVVISFLIIFIAGLVGFHFLAISVQKLVRMTFLGWVDRFCGGALGLIVGMLVASLLITVTLELPVSPQVRRTVEQSSVCMFVRPMAPWLFDFVFSHGDRGVSYRSIFKRGGAV